MNILDHDLFELFRLLLATVCAVYAVVVTVRWLLMLADQLMGSDRKVQVAKNYAVVLLLRMRFRRFKREIAGIAAYSAILVLLLFRH